MLEILLLIIIVVIYFLNSSHQGRKREIEKKHKIFWSSIRFNFRILWLEIIRFKQINKHKIMESMARNVRVTVYSIRCNYEIVFILLKLFAKVRKRKNCFDYVS